jgi:hypothetical protein
MTFLSLVHLFTNLSRRIGRKKKKKSISSYVTNVAHLAYWILPFLSQIEVQKFHIVSMWWRWMTTPMEVETNNKRRQHSAMLQRVSFVAWTAFLYHNRYSAMVCRASLWLERKTNKLDWRLLLQFNPLSNAAMSSVLNPRTTVLDSKIWNTWMEITINERKKRNHLRRNFWCFSFKACVFVLFDDHEQLHQHHCKSNMKWQRELWL